MLGTSSHVEVLVSSALVTILCAVAVSRYVESRRQGARRRYLRARDSLSPDQIYQVYFAKTGVSRDAFIRTWLQVADILGLDPTRLRPSDRFDEELAPAKGYLQGDELVELNAVVRDESRRAGVVSPSQMATLFDVIVFLARQREP